MSLPVCASMVKKFLSFPSMEYVRGDSSVAFISVTKVSFSLIVICSGVLMIGRFSSISTISMKNFCVEMFTPSSAVISTL